MPLPRAGGGPTGVPPAVAGAGAGVGAELSARWFQALYEAPQLFAALLSPDGVVLDANHLAVEGCGLQRSDVVGRVLWEGGWWSGDGQLRTSITGWCWRVASSGEPERATVRLRTAAGWRLADLALSPVRDDRGGVSHLVLTGTDVTDAVTLQQERELQGELLAEAQTADQVAQARARDLERLAATEAELARALQLAEKVLDNVGDGIYGLGADGRAEFVNPTAARLTGYAQADLIGQDMHALLHSRDPDGSPYPLQQCPTWRALHTGQAVAAPDEVFWCRDGSALPVSVIAVPIIGTDGAVAGAVVSFRDNTAARESERQAELLAQVTAREAGQRELADRLQQALLTPPPEPDHLHIVTRYRTAAHEAQVGGDWYDALLQPDGACVLVVGDVVGHDSAAAAAMGQLRGVLRTLAYSRDHDTPAQILAAVEHTAAGLAVDCLATVVLARIERTPDVPVVGTRTLRWSNAGHPPPVLLHADGTSTVLDAEPDLLLGVDASTARTDHTVTVEDGATLLMFTDGLVERRDADLSEGIEALQQALADLGQAALPELCDTLLMRMAPHIGEDDIALLAVRAYPEDRPRPAVAGPNRLPGPHRRPG